MNKTLAEQLKLAGFPQGTEPCDVCNDSDPKCLIALRNRETLRFPNLLTLIKECDVGFIQLKKLNNCWSALGRWNGADIICMQSDLEVAVANLWLELKKRKYVPAEISK